MKTRCEKNVVDLKTMHVKSNTHNVMEWFALPPSGKATKEEIDHHLNEERDSWGKE